MAAAELQAQVGMGLHGLDIAEDLVSGVGQLDNKRAVLFVPCRIRVGFCHNHSNIGDACG